MVAILIFSYKRTLTKSDFEARSLWTERMCRPLCFVTFVTPLVVRHHRHDKWAPSSPGNELITANPQLWWWWWWWSSVTRGRRKCAAFKTPRSARPASPLTPMTQLLTLTPPRAHVHTSDGRDRRSRPERSDWHGRMWHQPGRLRDREEKVSVILVLRNAMCWRSCETLLALWLTFRKAPATRPGSGRVMCQGKRLVSVDSTLSNLYTTLAPQPPGNWAAPGCSV